MWSFCLLYNSLGASICNKAISLPCTCALSHIYFAQSIHLCSFILNHISHRIVQIIQNNKNLKLQNPLISISSFIVSPWGAIWIQKKRRMSPHHEGYCMLAGLSSHGASYAASVILPSPTPYFLFLSVQCSCVFLSLRPSWTICFFCSTCGKFQLLLSAPVCSEGSKEHLNWFPRMQFTHCSRYLHLNKVVES